MDINRIIQQIIILAPPILFALTIHELAHGYTAWKLGDPTAKNQGRLSLNPLKHLDPFGTIAFFIIHFGWAKPVPVDPRYFSNPQKGMLLVALAGPAANVFLAIASALLAKIFIHMTFIPIFVLKPLIGMLAASVWLNLVLAVFNCLPIPPLDGSKVLMGLLPPKAAYSYSRIEPFSLILLVILIYTGAISKVIMPIIHFSNNLLLG